MPRRRFRRSWIRTRRGGISSSRLRGGDAVYRSFRRAPTSRSQLTERERYTEYQRLFISNTRFPPGKRQFDRFLRIIQQPYGPHNVPIHFRRDPYRLRIRLANPQFPGGYVPPNLRGARGPLARLFSGLFGRDGQISFRRSVLFDYIKRNQVLRDFFFKGEIQARQAQKALIVRQLRAGRLTSEEARRKLQITPPAGHYRFNIRRTAQEKFKIFSDRFAHYTQIFQTVVQLLTAASGAGGISASTVAVLGNLAMVAVADEYLNQTVELTQLLEAEDIELLGYGSSYDAYS